MTSQKVDNIYLSFKLQALGLVALADIKTITNRTALISSASYLDILFLAPGIHCQQTSSEINHGEYLTTGALTSGYVFRVENQATVRFLQRVGKTRHLVCVSVSSPSTFRHSIFTTGILSSILYLCRIALTVRGLYIGIIVHLYTPSPSPLVLVL